MKSYKLTITGLVCLVVIGSVLVCSNSASARMVRGTIKEDVGGLLEKILRGDLRFDNITEEQIQILEEHYSTNPVTEDVIIFLALLTCPRSRGKLVPDSINERGIDAVVKIYKSLTEIDRNVVISYLTLAAHKANIGDFVYTVIERLKYYEFEGGENTFDYRIPLDFRMAIVINPKIIRELATLYGQEIEPVLTDIQELLEQLESLDGGIIQDQKEIERELIAKQIEFYVKTDLFLDSLPLQDFSQVRLFVNTIIFEVRSEIGNFAWWIFYGPDPHENIARALGDLEKTRLRIRLLSGLTSIKQIRLSDTWKGSVIDMKEFRRTEHNP